MKTKNKCDELEKDFPTREQLMEFTAYSERRRIIDAAKSLLSIPGSSDIEAFFTMVSWAGSYVADFELCRDDFKGVWEAKGVYIAMGGQEAAGIDAVEAMSKLIINYKLWELKELKHRNVEEPKDAINDDLCHSCNRSVGSGNLDDDGRCSRCKSTPVVDGITNDMMPLLFEWMAMVDRKLDVNTIGHSEEFNKMVDKLW